MRFASLGGSNAGKYAAAGRAASNSFSKVLAAQLESRPDHAGLAIKAMNTASDEKIAGMKAEARLTSVAQKVHADQKRVDIDIDLFNKKSDINAGLRKAGGIAAIGKMVGAGYLASRDNTKNRPYPTGKAGRDGLLADHQATIDEINKRRKASADEFSSTIDNAGNSTGGGTKPGGVTPGSTTVTPSEGTGIRSQAFNYLTGDNGLSKNKALGIIANVDRESGWDPKIMSGDDGGYGGLFQWKGSRQTSTVQDLVKRGDWKGQLDYALNEPGEAYSQTYQQTSFDSPQHAADQFMTHFERPLDTASGSKKHTTFLSGYNF